MGEKKAKELHRLLTRSAQDTEVLAVFLFGSAARGRQTSGSDVDICLALAPQAKPYQNVFLSHKRLEYLRHVDLDVQVFQQLPLYIRRRVLKEGRVLLVKDEDLLYVLACRTAQAFEDFKHIYYKYLDQVAHAGP